MAMGCRRGGRRASGCCRQTARMRRAMRTTTASANLAEYQRGSHADKGFTRYLAEGAANGFMTTRLALVNPQNTRSRRRVAAARLQRESRDALPYAALARSRATITLAAGGEAPENDFATVVESNQPIVVDRTMTWDARRYGAHAETSIESPATTWYLAEGATHGNFDLFYLLLNASAVDATATVKYLRPFPAADRQDLHGARQRPQHDLGRCRRSRSRADGRLRRHHFRSADRRRTRDVFERERRAVRGRTRWRGRHRAGAHVVPGGRGDRQLLRPLPADRQSRPDHRHGVDHLSAARWRDD